MSTSLILDRFSVGVGDRFAHQADAQLQAFILAAAHGVEVTPVWNKSNREHSIIGSEPAATRAAADSAVRKASWKRPYFLDADHIRLETVERFLAPCDFFTIDVADTIGQPAPASAVEIFLDRHPELIGSLSLKGIEAPFNTTRTGITQFAGKYLLATQEAGRIYRHIAARKGSGCFITEVSMDETDLPQTPPELLLILVALADEGVPVQTIAPKFTGRFNKGVDYVGDITQFEREFNNDLAVIAHAVSQYGLPTELKLSVHSGSDKFSIYAPIRRALKRFNAGVHLKTAGTTWLEEVIGLAGAGGNGLALAQAIYAEALSHIDELCAPYATVIDIDRDRLPSVNTVAPWTSDQFVAALQHDPNHPSFNSSLRQLVHVGFKVAAKMGPRYLTALKHYEKEVSNTVTNNLFERHLKPLFLD
ncbi:MAG: hypothetical protein EXS25_06985 [Pedosphaera sp.]|nr:hypothetical protein [Pedosphaera sp.]